MSYKEYSERANKNKFLLVGGRQLSREEFSSIEDRMLDEFDPTKFPNKRTAKKHLVQKMVGSSILLGIFARIIINFIANLILRRFYPKG